MRAKWVFLFAAALAAALAASLGLPRPVAAEATAGCLPDERLPVTVLVRSDRGLPFEGLETSSIDPFIDARTSRTWVPARSLVTALAPGSDPVRWYEDTRTATFWYGTHKLEITFPRGANRTFTATLDGRAYGLHAALCAGKVWVPARTLADAFGVDVYYRDFVVVIDPVGGLDSNSQPSTPLTTQPVLATSQPAAEDCGPRPRHILGFLAAPRQVAAAIACQLHGK